MTALFAERAVCEGFACKIRKKTNLSMLFRANILHELNRNVSILTGEAVDNKCTSMKSDCVQISGRNAKHPVVTAFPFFLAFFASLTLLRFTPATKAINS